MNDMIRTPVHLWIVGVVSALWNSFGALDFVMSQTRNPAWMAQMNEAQRAYVENAPALMTISWGCGTLGALAGSLLLLARSRHAVTAFGVSLAGLAVNTAYQIAVPMPGAHMDGAAQIGFHLVIWAVAIALLLYALRMRRAGVLR